MPEFDFYANVTLRLADGSTVGPTCIQGAGGFLRWTEQRRFERELERAQQGVTLTIAEPRPGHAVARIPVTTANDDDRYAEIDLRGASLVAWEKRPR